ncbi:pre-rRNA-processing protein ESF1 [Encephalitozoon intestinalis ATCC 50506]|uniref:Uncharacterized protein n=1 Tax=Encephalitozoon intestinalis (strain ATCC 50506) TaxID=876142 RepID=E0S9A4_ENCIT|nr:pre-rRNA-processing protein ESF1 [Encephalitozoon intestinalis ATCC 50506]ADM12168.2 hypothetical protein Eint_090380 [Encephalitozoon intestinalis ATCC 50506]UTX45970.1 NUC153 domain-containing protein [Encephalitozoon intestinalis]
MKGKDLKEEIKESSGENRVMFGNPTKRLACIGMNWRNINVKDLFKIFNSILLGSSPLSVKLCKTKIGRERLGDNNIFVKSCEEGRIDECYTAVAEFEDVDDSKHIYTACDGVRLGNSGMVFDLRFVPDSLDLQNVCDEAFNDDGCEEKDFVVREKKEEEDDSEIESRLEKLFKEKEINFDLVSELVDMSDDENISGLQDHLPISSENEKSKFLESSSDDFNDEISEDKEIENKKAKKKESSKKDIETIPRGKPIDECDGFMFDPKDKRFEAIFEDEDFAIDPTHPEYKRKGGLKEILDEKRKRIKDNID